MANSELTFELQQPGDCLKVQQSDREAIPQVPAGYGTDQTWALAEETGRSRRG